MTERRAVFFPHNKIPNVTDQMGPPGRVPFHVECEVVGRESVTRSDVTVIADGFAADVPGPNQDPCVFSETAPVHAFCRIGTNKSSNHVQGTVENLAAFVRPDDVIIYGNFEPFDEPVCIWVDTVLVVRDVLPWTTVPKESPCINPLCEQHDRRRVTPAEFAESLTGISGEGSKAYRYCFKDAEPDGSHCCTPIIDYLVIRGAGIPSPLAVSNIQTSFVPLAVKDGGGWSLPSVDLSEIGETGAVLRSFWHTSVRPLNSDRAGRIATLPDFDVVAALLEAVRARSGKGQGHEGSVAVPPLAPLAVRGRWNPWSLQIDPDC